MGKMRNRKDSGAAMDLRYSTTFGPDRKEVLKSEQPSSVTDLPFKKRKDSDASVGFNLESKTGSLTSNKTNFS
jgi:hypothetical protein